MIRFAVGDVVFCTPPTPSVYYVSFFLGGCGGMAKNWLYVKWRSLSAELSFRSQGEVRYFVVTVHPSLWKAFEVLQVRKFFPETAWVQTRVLNSDR